MKQLKAVQYLLLRHPNLVSATTLEVTLKHQLQQLQVEAATARAADRKVVDEMFGESSTYWFHRQGKHPPAPELIRVVQDPATPGITVSLSQPGGTARAGDLLADYYDGAVPTGLFAVRPTDTAAQQSMLQAVDKQLTAEQQQQCQGPTPDGTITLEEATEVLSSLQRGKSPGSDGLTYEVYIAFWAELGPLLVDAFNEAFLSSSSGNSCTAVPLLDRQRLGLIVLIYKGGGKPRDDPDSYRPITLLNCVCAGKRKKNCDVKIITKILTARIGPVLNSVIDQTQTAFVPGRQIYDNVMYHLEEIDYLHEEQQPGVIVFLDFAKAYDRLDRGWLWQCMQHLNFPATVTTWVQLLLQDTFFFFCQRTFTWK